jgi:hypothetical protein
MNSLYNVDESVEVARPPSDAYLVLDSADRSSSTSATALAYGPPPTQPYNNFRLQKPENMVQGGFTRLQLTEVNFPYAIPNVNERNNQMWVVAENPALPGNYLTTQIVIPKGTYAGNELAFVLAFEMNDDAVIGTAATGITWVVQYSPFASTFARKGFYIKGVLAAGPPEVLNYFSLFPLDPNKIGTQQIPPKSLLDLIGFSSLSDWDYITKQSYTKSSSYAPLTYTKYIDIVSNKLTYYANVKDSSTRTNSGSSMICRLYIANETSDSNMIGYYYNGVSPVRYDASVPPGSVPFLIHRQFMAPKQFKWEPDTAVDWVDIQLLDDVGMPLYVPEQGLPDFQITFKCTED